MSASASSCISPTCPCEMLTGTVLEFCKMLLLLVPCKLRGSLLISTRKPFGTQSWRVACGDMNGGSIKPCPEGMGPIPTCCSSLHHCAPPCTNILRFYMVTAEEFISLASTVSSGGWGFCLGTPIRCVHFQAPNYLCYLINSCLLTNKILKNLKQVTGMMFT